MKKSKKKCQSSRPHCDCHVATKAYVTGLLICSKCVGLLVVIFVPIKYDCKFPEYLKLEHFNVLNDSG